MGNKNVQKQIFLGVLYLLAIILVVYLFLSSFERFPRETLAFGLLLFLLNFFKVDFPRTEVSMSHPILISSLFTLNVISTVSISFLAFLKKEEIEKKHSLYEYACLLSKYLISISLTGLLFIGMGGEDLLDLKALSSENVIELLFLMMLCSVAYFIVFKIIDFFQVFFYEDVKVGSYFSKENTLKTLNEIVTVFILSFFIYLIFLWAGYIGLLLAAVSYYFWRDFYMRNHELESNFTSNQRLLIGQVEEKAVSYNNHSQKVEEISEKIAERMGLDKNRINTLKQAALLHDIGMLGEIRKYSGKPERLTYEEYKKIQDHPQHAVNILRSHYMFRSIQKAILYHHEHYDGTGYPQGLIGESIPLMSRIISVADAYDSLTSPRSFRKKIEPEEAREELIRFSGTQFDPDIVDIVAYLIEEGKI